MHDGSMSGDEYLRQAAELSKRRAELDNEDRVLRAHRQIAEAKQVLNTDLLADAFRDAGRTHGTPRDSLEIDFSAKHSVRTKVVPLDDATLIVRGVHNLPTRVACGSPSFSGARSATEPMRAQMTTGKYPTLQDHLAHNSPAYEPTIDTMGQFAARLLTQEEENDIRNRTGLRALRRSP